jgi:hypothetical protein
MQARERDDLEKMFVTKVAGQAVAADPEMRWNTSLGEWEVARL